MSLPERIPVSSIMSTQLVILNKTDSLEKAEHLFKKHHIRHIPAVIVGVNTAGSNYRTGNSHVQHTIDTIVIVRHQVA